MLTQALEFSGAVEGPTDEAVLRRVVEQLGARLRVTYGKEGKTALLARLASYNRAAQYRPWIVLVDLDSSAACAPPAREQWLPSPASQMCFRIAVRKVEAWLLADRETLAGFLGVPVSVIPAQPESLDDPKRTLVDLARRSRRRAVCADMVPRPQSGRSEGPAYTSRLIEYTQSAWRPEVAALQADSLRRLRDRLADRIAAGQ